MPKNDNLPGWVEAVFESMEVVTGAAEPLQWAFNQAEQQLIFAPALAEIEGGADDGAEVFTFYDVELRPIFLLFDDVPSVFFSTFHGECSVEGTIDEKQVWIVFRTNPFDGDSPSYKIKNTDSRKNHEVD